MAVWLARRLAACFRKDMLHHTHRPELLGSSAGSCRHVLVGQGYGPDLRQVVVHPIGAYDEDHPKKVARQGVLVGP